VPLGPAKWRSPSRSPQPDDIKAICKSGRLYYVPFLFLNYFEDETRRNYGRGGRAKKWMTKKSPEKELEKTHSFIFGAFFLPDRKIRGCPDLWPSWPKKSENNGKVKKHQNLKKTKELIVPNG
jgi:hypothetical protein